MPQKRKLRQGDESFEESVMSKRVKNEQSDDNEEVKDINNEATYKEVLEHLYSQRDADDRPLWKMFDVLPSEEEFPVYYEFIKDPIDLRKIKKNIQTHQYNSIDELEVDILLVFKNAHAFNEPKSQISKDATQLKKAYLAKRIELNKSLLSAKVGKRLKYRNIELRNVAADSEHSDTDDVKLEDAIGDEGFKNKSFDDGVPRQISSPMETKDDGLIDQTFEHNVFSVLYNMVVGYLDSSGRQLALPFIRQPTKKHNPGYYERIKRPLSLGKIRTKIKASYYSDINILEKDMNCVFENALICYEEGSTFHMDALFLQRLMNEKKCELEKTTQYIEMRELMPKRGRPRVPKGEKGDPNDDGYLAIRRRSKQRDGLSAPETADPKLQKQRMLSMYNCIYEYKDSEGRSLSNMFLELPDPEEYPDYYKVIPHPIDMDRIHEKIESGEYVTEDDFIHDFEILFQNARHYNEEGSEIYEDSVILEKALKKERRYLNRVADGKKSSPGKHRESSPSSMLRKSYLPGPNKCQELLHHIRSYIHESGRVLSAIFEKLPSRTEYPDYYLLIKRPIDLTYISSRCHKYPSVDDLEQDLLLLFNNACIYNEPDSQIYKDALTLLRIMTQKKSELCPEAENELPDVSMLVQDLLVKLFTNVMDHRDEEGRCYSDSLLEVAVTDDNEEDEEKKRKTITLPIIGQLLKLGFYRRLDMLQDDIFSILKKARREAVSDAEMYEDACELHTYFILERDFLTKDGLRMLSPALNVTGKGVQQEIDYERKEKLQHESGHADETEVEAPRLKGKFRGAIIFEVTPDEQELTFLRTVVYVGETYTVGDFVYVKPEDPTRPPNIMSIDKIWKQSNGLQGVYGCWYYRPEATYHLASRKFMEREVFKSHQNTYVMLHGVVGKCFVMNVKEYIKFKPQNFEDEDIYVCESRYNANTKAFKKIKTSVPSTTNNVTMMCREVPLQVKRVSSIFAVTTPPEGKKDNLLEVKKEEITSTVGYEVPVGKLNALDITNPEEGCKYFERYRTENELWKIGDCVYVKSDEGYLYLSRIDKLWEDASGTAYFRGNWFVLPEDTKHLPTQFFMEQECFESNLEETRPVSMISGRCAILNQRDYQLTRPTELSEKDVYVCSAFYNEDELKFRKNMKGFKKLSVSEHIRDDEYWIFDRPYQAKRRPSRWLTSTEINAVSTEEGKEKEKEKEEDADNIGFALMKKEFAANLMKENPEIPLEEIASKTEENWNTLTEEEKEEFKLRGKKQGLVDEYILVFQCCWGTCQYQFEDLQDLMVHVMEGPHLGEGTSIHSCDWRDCNRVKKEMKPFPTHSRLVRHIREVHFKNAGNKILASQKSKFYFPRHQACEELYKQNRESENSDRPSSRDSSTASSLSPLGHLKTNRQPMSPGMMQNVPNSQMFPNPMHLQAGMFPPYRMNNQPTPQAVMQQQIMQQQQMMMQSRGQMINNLPQRPQMVAPPPQHPQQVSPLLSVDQQQMLIAQVQRQQQQILKLQQQVQQLVVQQQQKQAMEEQQEQQSPVFVSPPASTQKLRHSEAYLRYIEGLRDNKSSLSNWNELADNPHPKTSNPLPTEWVGDKHGFDSAADALWALRDHMLRDAVSISKIL